MSKKYYCDKCGEENLLSFIDCDLRPFNIYCGEGCIDTQWSDIEHGRWDNHDGVGEGLEIYYAKELKHKHSSFFWRKWFLKHSDFMMWNKKKRKYEVVKEKDYISHSELENQ